MTVHILTIAAAAGALLFLSGCGEDESPPRQFPGRGGEQAPAYQPVDLEHPPVSVYVKSCASCHGPKGSLFGGELKRQGEDLAAMTLQMLRGSGEFEPTATETDAMVDFVKSLVAEEPYAVIINGASIRSGSAEDILVEVSGEGTVELSDETAVAPAAGAVGFDVVPGTPFQVMFTSDNKKAEFEFPTRQWSEPTLTPTEEE